MCNVNTAEKPASCADDMWHLAATRAEVAKLEHQAERRKKQAETRFRAGGFSCEGRYPDQKGTSSNEPISCQAQLLAVRSNKQAETIREKLRAGDFDKMLIPDPSAPDRAKNGCCCGMVLP
ncbi:unnamed protein product [Symbiodinium natans]|uniref:Uncharacterized protein n=1 Tax=Symbiodinium natans TaxID=878477 RepID=A0A812RB01_9DINO|nr:unnamed protein product [Symbiodinium natans]